MPAGRLLIESRSRMYPHGMIASSVDLMQCHPPQIWIRSCQRISHSGALAGYTGRWRTVPKWLSELWYED